MSTELLISAERVAVLLGISKRTLWRLLSSGKLPEPIRLGGIIRWNAGDIEEWVKDGCRSPRNRDN